MVACATYVVVRRFLFHYRALALAGQARSRSVTNHWHSDGRGRCAMATMLLEKRAMVDDDRTCDCGQALDCCHTSHCPRCGTTLRV